MNKINLLFSCLMVCCFFLACSSDTSTATTTTEESPASIEVATEAVPDTEKEVIAATKTPELIEIFVEDPDDVKTAKTPEKKADVKEKVATVSKKTESNRATAPKKASPPPKKKASGKATMVFEQTEHDFGFIEPGEVIEHNFYFTNTGKGELIIKNADVTCGCTTPSYPFIPIAPGERGFIGVTYNSTGKLGRQKPTVTLYTNVGTKKINMAGYVVSAMEEEKPAPAPVPSTSTAIDSTGN